MQPRNSKDTIPINNNHNNRFHPILLIPIVDAVANDIYHDRTFWGIRFPVYTSSFHQAAIGIVKKYLEGCGNPVLKVALQGFNLAVVVLAVVIEVDGKSVEHTIVFFGYKL